MKPTATSSGRPSRRHEKYLAAVIVSVAAQNGDVSRVDPARVDRSCDQGITASAAAALEVRAGVDAARRERRARS